METGQFTPPDTERPDGLSHEEVAWAIEQGAESEEEILEMIKKHEQYEE